MNSLRDYNAAVDFVDRNVAEGRGAKAAFIDPSRNLPYAELSDAAARIGPVLARLGIERENRIAIEEDGGRKLYEELKLHVKRTIGPWKYPRWIEFVDSLPKTATGKLQRYMQRDAEPRPTGGGH